MAKKTTNASEPKETTKTVKAKKVKESDKTVESKKTKEAKKTVETKTKKTEKTVEPKKTKEAKKVVETKTKKNEKTTEAKKAKEPNKIVEAKTKKTEKNIEPKTKKTKKTAETKKAKEANKTIETKTKKTKKAVETKIIEEPKKTVETKTKKTEKITETKKNSSTPQEKKTRKKTKKTEPIITSSIRYSDADLEEFRAVIETQKNEALEELRMLKERLVDLTKNISIEDTMVYSDHMGEQGSEALEKEKTYAQVKRISEYIQKLNEALTRIDDKTYGICRVCNCLIAKARLLEVPITTLSASYKIHQKCPEDGIDRIESININK